MLFDFIKPDLIDLDPYSSSLCLILCTESLLKLTSVVTQADDNNITGKADVGLHKDNNNPQGTRGNSISPPKDATSHTKPGNVNSKGIQYLLL